MEQFKQHETAPPAQCVPGKLYSAIESHTNYPSNIREFEYQLWQNKDVRETLGAIGYDSVPYHATRTFAIESRITQYDQMKWTVEKSFNLENGSSSDHASIPNDPAQGGISETTNAPVLVRNPDIRKMNDRQIFEIPCYVAHTHLTDALGDYCARYNFMNEQYAQQKELHIDWGQTTEVSIGNGKKVTTSGVVTTPFRFHDETGDYYITFHLLRNCIHDVILGRPFLKATRTFSAIANCTRRVKSRIVQGLRRRHFLYLGDSMPRFQGLINGKPEFGLADSGAKVMVMDEDYARSRSLYICSGDRTELVFADGSTAHTCGIAYGVRWEFGTGSETADEIEGRKEHRLDFHILKNAPANVIFSDSFLFGTEAYSKYNCFLVDDDDEDDEAYFFAIDYAEYEHAQIDMNTLANTQYAEDMLRDSEDDVIMNLQGAEKATEQARVNTRREHWKRDFDAQKQRLGLALAQISAPMATASTSSGTTIDQRDSPPSAISTDHATLPWRKDFWKRFKLKRRTSS